MLESDWLMNVLRHAIIFREMHGERSSRQFSWPQYSSVSLCQMISVISNDLQKKNNKTDNDTGQTNKYSKQKDKIDRSCPCFCHKITFYLYGKNKPTLSLPLSVSPSQKRI